MVELNSVGDLAEQARLINAAHERRQEAESQSHEKLRLANGAALQVGERLLQVKQQLKHGEFVNWMEDNCQFDARHGQRYMALAKHKEWLDQLRPVWMQFLTPTDAMAEAARLAKKARCVKRNSPAKSHPQDEQDRHDERSETFRTLVEGEEVEVDGEMAVVDEAAAEDFQTEARKTLSKLALRHGRRLCKQHNDRDPVLIAMLLVDRLQKQLDPVKVFAPEAHRHDTVQHAASSTTEPIEVGETALP